MKLIIFLLVRLRLELLFCSFSLDYRFFSFILLYIMYLWYLYSCFWRDMMCLIGMACFGDLRDISFHLDCRDIKNGRPRSDLHSHLMLLLPITSFCTQMAWLPCQSSSKPSVSSDYPQAMSPHRHSAQLPKKKTSSKSISPLF